MPWFTVIARYEDEPQTIADWLEAPTAKQAAQRCADERGESCNVLAALKGRQTVTWTPEHVGD